MNSFSNNASAYFVFCRLRLIMATAAMGFFILSPCSTVVAQSKAIDSLQRELTKHLDDSLGIRAAVLLASEFSRIDLPKSRQILYECLTRVRAQKSLYGYSACYAQ